MPEEQEKKAQEENSPEAPQDNEPETPQDSEPETPQDSEPETPQDSEPETPQDSEPETPQDSEPEAPQDSEPETPQDSEPETPQDSEPETPQDSEPETPQDSEPEAPQDSEPEAPQDSEPETPQDSEPETPQDSEPEAPQDSEPETPQDSEPEAPQDNELVAGEVHEELSEQQVFVGDEDFHTALEDYNQSPDADKPPKKRIWNKYQKILGAAFIMIGLILLYTLLKSLSVPTTSSALTPAGKTPQAAQQTTPSQSPAAYPALAQQEHTEKPEPVLDPAQPISLKVARDFYQQNKFYKAYAAYNQLWQTLPEPMKNQKDFLRLKMALCAEKSGDIKQAKRLLDTLAKTPSCIVRVMANYRHCVLEMKNKQYLTARIRAYRALALTSIVALNQNLSSSLQSDCHFLIAESMTRNILSLCDADTNLPPELWSNPADIEPFANLNNEQLRSLLYSGSGYLNEGLLGPQIQKLESQDAAPRWSVVANGAPIEELLARFAANAGLDISWDFSSDQTLEPTQSTVRQRTVTLYLPAATTQQFLSVAAGQVGLIARLDDKVVTISRHDIYPSLSQHLSLLTTQTVSLWQRFLLAFHGDERLPNAHFAIGLLQSKANRKTEAIAEYKLVANRFSNSPLAPFALLNSSTLKNALRDYAGARQDLKQLVELYPDSEITGRAYLLLADNTAKAALTTEAARLHRKVYNLSLSSQSQRTAAIGAARCFYQINDFESAVKWAARYIDLAKSHKKPGGPGAHKELASAYLLLGKSYLAMGNSQQACDAFQYILAEPLSKQDYLETISALVEGYFEQKNFIQALDVLELTRSRRLSAKESVRILLLKCRTLREMGLIDQAVTALADRAEYILDPQLKANISYELTNCHIAKGDLELAHKNLTEILAVVSPGPLANKTAFKLADVSLKLGQNSQVVSICSQLLDSDASEQIKHQTEKILAAAYGRQKNYDKAALLLCGQPK